MLCVARVTHLSRPTCRASALPLEERRRVFRVMQTLPPETKGEDAEQGPKEAAEGAVAGAEVSARGDGGPAGEHVRVVVPLPFERHTRMVLLCLSNPPRSSGGSYFRRYNAFILLLAMVRPMQVDGTWEWDGLLYNPLVAQLLSRKECYVLRRNIRPHVVELLEECNGQLAGAWRLGGAACGDDSVVLHKGIRAGPLRMFIARKPHSTAIPIALPMPLAGTSWTCICTRAYAGTCGGGGGDEGLWGSMGGGGVSDQPPPPLPRPTPPRLPRRRTTVMRIRSSRRSSTYPTPPG